jgi:hypothetical protein
MILPACTPNVICQQHLDMKELRLIQGHLEKLHTEISAIVTNYREGHILLSMPPTRSASKAS